MQVSLSMAYSPPPSSPRKIDSSTHNLLDYDVTDLVKKLGWQGLELNSRLTENTVVGGLPDPVVKKRSQRGSASKWDSGPVSLPIGAKQGDYGDLLDGFYIVAK